MSDFDPIASGDDASELTGPSKPPTVDQLDAEVSDDVIAANVLAAEVIEPLPRLWPTFAVVAAAIIAAIVVSGLTVAVAALASGNLQSLRDPELQKTWLAEFASSGVRLSVLVLPGQIVFAAFAMVAALFSRDRWVDRLGLRSGRLPAWTWLLFLAGTPIVGMFASQLMSGVADEPSEQLKMFERMFQFDSLSSLVTLLLLVSLLPGIVEEILFRGYLQRRLLTRLPALASIVICSFLFAAAHMDPMHAVGVLPLGLWLGVIAWRADSIWPAMFGHIGNNGYAIVLSKMMGSDPDLQEVNPMVLTFLGLSLLAFFGSIVVLAVRRDRPQQGAAMSEMA